MAVVPALDNLQERIPRRAVDWARRLGLSAVVGVVAGVAAAALDWAIHTGSHALIGRFSHFGSAETLHPDWRIAVLPAVGGLVAGVFVYLLARKSTGHGVNEVSRAFHRNLGFLPVKGPAIKAAGTALVISTGGSAGPEGPIAALGAGIGSTIARLFPLTPRERRILLIAGCAAGIGAIFRCPLGGALFATSILYREPDFESEAIVPSFVASVIGYSVYMLIHGYQGPMLPAVDTLHFTAPSDLLWYAALGVLCGLFGIFFYYCMRTAEKGVERGRRWPRWIFPMLGGLGTGLIACLLPQVMDGRYEFIKGALDGRLFDADGSAVAWSSWALLFALVAAAKCVTTGLTVGSGAPGGVLGPSVFIGGALGASVGALGLALFPDAVPDELRRALIPVGMAGVLAATMRIPLAAIVMTLEMTGSFGLIAPLMVVCSTSYVIGRRWGLNHEQVGTAADSPTHVADQVINLLQSWRVGDLMSRDWPMTVKPDAPVDALLAHLDPGTRPVIAVVDDGVLRGVISAKDVGVMMTEIPAAPVLIAADMMSVSPTYLDEDEDVYSALTTFTTVDDEVLPVLSHGREKRWVGMLARRHIVDTLRHGLAQSHEIAFREHLGLQALEDEAKVDQLVMAVPGEHADVQRLFVPIDAIGKSLKDCDFRRKYNAQVIAIEQRDGSMQCPPDLDAPLRTEQRLLAVVWQNDRPS